MQEVEEITSVSRAGESLVKVEAKLAFSHTQAELDQVWDKLRSKIAEVSRAMRGREEEEGEKGKGEGAPPHSHRPGPPGRAGGEGRLR